MSILNRNEVFKLQEINIIWHKASEELPKQSCRVIIANPNGFIIDTEYSSKFKLFNCSDNASEYGRRRNGIAPYKVSYWAYSEDLFGVLFKRKSVEGEEI